MRTTIRQVLAGSLLFVLVACSAGKGSSSNPSAVRSKDGEPIEIELVDTDFQPSTIMVKAGSQVTLTLVNDGTVKHNLTIKDAEMDVSQDVAVGKTETLTFTAPANPGQHRIVCDQPGHEQAGMVGTLVVEE